MSYAFHEDVDIVIRKSVDGVGAYSPTDLGLPHFYRLERPLPNFSSDLPKEFHGSSFNLRRTPAKGKLVATATCDNLVGCPTHFFGGHTVPCEAPNCPACDEGHPWRWHGYISATDWKTGEHFLFEMTAQAAEYFATYRKQHGTLRGCLFEATRRGQYRNGRVVIRCKTADLNQVTLPESPDLVACLCQIWHVERPEAAIDGRCKNVDRIVVDRKPDGNNKPVRQTQPIT